MAELPIRSALIEILDDGPEATLAVAGLNDRGRNAGLISPPAEAWQPGRLWQPSRIAQIAAERLSPPLRVLDLGAGAGRDAVFLAAHGFRVTAIDRLPDALLQTRQLAARYDVSVATALRDVRREPLPEADLWLMVRFFDAALLETRPTRTGLALECFSAAHRARHGKPKHVPDLTALQGPDTLFAEAWGDGDVALCGALIWPSGSPETRESRSP